MSNTENEVQWGGSVGSRSAAVVEAGEGTPNPLVKNFGVKVAATAMGAPGADVSMGPDADQIVTNLTNIANQNKTKGGNSLV